MEELSPEERGSRVERRAAQWERLRRLVALAWERSAFYRRGWEAAGLRGADSLKGPEDWLQLGTVTREEFIRDQQAHPPLGTVPTVPGERLVAVHRVDAEEGPPLYWYDDPASWEWVQGLWDTVFRAAGAGPGDRVLFACDFAPVAWHWAAFERAQRLGLMVVSGAAMNSVQRLQNLLELEVTLLVGAPDELLELARAAAEHGMPVWKSRLRRIVYPCPAGRDPVELGRRLAAAWRAEPLAVRWLGEAGLTAFECRGGTGRLHLMESELYVEVVDPAIHSEVGPGG